MSTLSKIIIGIVVLLTVISLFTLYSALHQGGEMIKGDLFGKQIMWFCISWFLLWLFARVVSHRHFYDAAWILYGITMAMLVVIFVLGEARMGAQRWLTIFGLNFQPSELAKFTTILLAARFFSRMNASTGRRKTSFIQQMVIPFVPIGAMFILIFLQPDLGSGMLLVFLFYLMALFCGVKKNYIVIVTLFALMCAPIGWHVLKDYQKARLTVFLNPDVDPLGAGYTIIQSKIAIGSGQWWGKGFLAGTQNQLNFLPERHTDFIFTIIAEEWGFLGVGILLILYYSLVMALFRVSMLARDEFSKYVGIGIASLFTLQLCINISMTMGLLPVVGVPLLFMSYGGTHIMLECMLVGVVLNIARENRL